MIRNIAKRLGQQLVWMSMTEEEHTQETRQKTLAVFHQEWAETSLLADTRFAHFKECFQDYRRELEKVRQLDAEHEARSLENFRKEPIPGLNHYLDEARPLTSQEMVLVDLYRSTKLAWRALHDALDSLFALKNALLYSKVFKRSEIIELYRKREDEYTERKLQLQPFEVQFVQYSDRDSKPPANASAIDVWRAKQNRRRHAG